MEAHHKNGYIDSIKAITKSLSGDTRRLVFNDCLRPSSVPVLQTILMGPVHRLSLNEPLISQKIKVAEDKLAKVRKPTTSKLLPGIVNCEVAFTFLLVLSMFLPFMIGHYKVYQETL